MEAQGVLLTGPFGSGKSTVATELAELLEERGVPYAAIDLDWLSWGTPGDGDEHAMLLRNLAPVVANYLDAGAVRFVLARWLRTPDQLASLRATMPMPLRVVRLTAPWPEIERRLRADASSSRAVDLREAMALGEAMEAPVDGELVVANDRGLREVAVEVLERLGWNEPPGTR
ncbi:MAG: adenylyl-sulfate kinase [Actinomycetota bacterium]